MNRYLIDIQYFYFLVRNFFFVLRFYEIKNQIRNLWNFLKEKFLKLFFRLSLLQVTFVILRQALHVFIGDEVSSGMSEQKKKHNEGTLEISHEAIIHTYSNLIIELTHQVLFFFLNRHKRFFFQSLVILFLLWVPTDP